jgi:hypothetical protein
MKLLRHAFLLIALFQALVARSEDKPSAAKPSSPETAAKPQEAKDYVRFIEDEKGAQLQTGVSTFRNAQGVTVDLVGAIHVADRTYYEQLNERFKRYDAVLYEMVGGPVEKRARRHKMLAPKVAAESLPPKEGPDKEIKVDGVNKKAPADKPAPKEETIEERVKAIENYIANSDPKLPRPSEPLPDVLNKTPPAEPSQEPDEASEEAGADRLSWLATLFTQMQKALALESQMTVVDYWRPNFVHADMSLTQFFKLQDERNEGFISLWLKAVKTQLANPGAGPANQPGFLKILEILCRSDSCTELKRMVGRTFDGVEALMTGIEGENGTVIIAERNKIALSVLQKQIAGGKKNLAIFYGSAHLQDMQKRLMAMGFARVNHEWLTAWNLPPEPQHEPTASLPPLEAPKPAAKP